MIRLKQGKYGVEVKLLRSVVLKAMVTVDVVFAAFDFDCWLTSFQRDPKPGSPSLHPDGWAMDFRANHISEENRQRILRALHRALPPVWDVVLHGRGANRHFHLEYDPKSIDAPKPR